MNYEKITYLIVSALLVFNLVGCSQGQLHHIRIINAYSEKIIVDGLFINNVSFTDTIVEIDPTGNRSYAFANPYAAIKLEENDVVSLSIVVASEKRTLSCPGIDKVSSECVYSIKYEPENQLTCWCDYISDFED